MNNRNGKGRCSSRTNNLNMRETFSPTAVENSRRVGHRVSTNYSGPEKRLRSLMLMVSGRIEICHECGIRRARRDLDRYVPFSAAVLVVLVVVHGTLFVLVGSRLISRDNFAKYHSGTNCANNTGITLHENATPIFDSQISLDVISPVLWIRYSDVRFRNLLVGFHRILYKMCRPLVTIQTSF